MGAMDKIKNRFGNKKDQAVGAVKETAGKAVNDKDLKREGTAQKGISNVKQAGTKAKDAIT